ncbi:hypothetical protein NW765_016966 [Fusarium oxysporum]|nr:hypothetical protein NW765_016966 [Fusarium oxysporum]
MEDNPIKKEELAGTDRTNITYSHTRIFFRVPTFTIFNSFYFFKFVFDSGHESEGYNEVESAILRLVVRGKFGG